MQNGNKNSSPRDLSNVGPVSPHCSNRAQISIFNCCPYASVTCIRMESSGTLRTFWFIIAHISRIVYRFFCEQFFAIQNDTDSSKNSILIIRLVASLFLARVVSYKQNKNRRSTMKIHLAENIRQLRKARGMMQEQLAEALGVSVGAVSKWERGVSQS